MSELEKCLMCSNRALYLCNCTPNTFLCSSHLQTHLTSVESNHFLESLQFKILPKDLETFLNIKETLKFHLENITKEILKNRTEKICPLLEEIQKIEKDCEKEIKIILKEYQDKIKEIEEMLITKEIRGKRKNILLDRVEESLKTAAERIYLGNQQNEILSFKKKVLSNILEEEKKLKIEHILSITENSRVVRSIAFSPDGEYLASGFKSLFKYLERNIHLWRISNGKRIITFAGHSSTVESVKFSPNGKYLASGSRDKTIGIWVVESGKRIKTLTGHSESVTSVIFSPNGEYLASGSCDKTIRIWEFFSGEIIITLKGHSNIVSSVEFSPNGEYLASGSWDSTISVWSLSTGEHIKSFVGHFDSVRSVAFSPNGEYLASGSGDRTIGVWEIESEECIIVFRGHSSVVRTVVFSPKGEYLASGSEDYTICLWRVEVGELIKRITIHSDEVNSLVFSPNGEFLASGSGSKFSLEEKTICVWSLY